jgi:hypothetical protein
MLFTVLIIALFLVGLLFVAHGTLVKNRWGINLDEVACPACGASGGVLRAPRSLRQVLWGGWTCQKCGCVMDKWGRAVTLR